MCILIALYMQSRIHCTSNAHSHAQALSTEQPPCSSYVCNGTWTDHQLCIYRQGLCFLHGQCFYLEMLYVSFIVSLCMQLHIDCTSACTLQLHMYECIHGRGLHLHQLQNKSMLHPQLTYAKWHRLYIECAY